MATTKKSKFEVAFDPVVKSVLSRLAKQEHKTVPGLVADLVLEALERREDLELSELAEARDTKHQKTVSHKNAWK